MKKNRGFTFIEIILAITILVIVVAVTYSALSQIIRIKKNLDDIRDNKYIADALLMRMTREFQLAYNGSSILPPKNNLTKPYPGQPKLVAEPVQEMEGEHRDSISFLTLEGGQYLPDGGTNTGIVQITYRVEKDPENRDGFVLVRDEVPVIQPPETAYKKMMTFPITDRIVGVSYRFFDSRDDSWVDSWGTPPRTNLPKIIKFTVSVKSPLGKVDSFTTAVLLNQE